MLKRILLTGAAGGVGRQLLPFLLPMSETVRLSDIVDPGIRGENIEIQLCDLSDSDAVDQMVSGCDAIVHLGGVSVEASYDKIRKANIDGVFNLYEAARKNGNPRIIFASSNHVVGFYRQDQRLDNTARAKPDGLYGVSKCFGEAMASMYHDKFGVETAIVRIGSCFVEPVNRRMLSSWFHVEDFADLIRRCFHVPQLGCPVIYGMSDNNTVWWDNSNVSWLGWKPKHNSEVFRTKVETSEALPDKDDVMAKYQGGKFTTDPIFED